jgi:hypothetical protein
LSISFAARIKSIMKLFVEINAVFPYRHSARPRRAVPWMKLFVKLA